MIKIQVTQQQRDNAIEARDVMWPSVPKSHVAPGLRDWRQAKHRPSGRREDWNETCTPTCNTLACFGGWCQHWPAFQAQHEAFKVWGVEKSAAALFGEKTMFSSYGYPDADHGFKGTDHEAVTNRLNWLIENSEVAR